MHTQRVLFWDVETPWDFGVAVWIAVTCTPSSVVSPASQHTPGPEPHPTRTFAVDAQYRLSKILVPQSHKPLTAP